MKKHGVLLRRLVRARGLLAMAVVSISLTGCLWTDEEDVRATGEANARLGTPLSIAQTVQCGDDAAAATDATHTPYPYPTAVAQFQTMLAGRDRTPTC